ncbi:hypothetical protein [Pseudoroseomonas wenyumeiae]|nr:hypothetical protein [Pseudoroseomonas wenyumeiae]
MRHLPISNPASIFAHRGQRSLNEAEAARRLDVAKAGNTVIYVTTQNDADVFPPEVLCGGRTQHIGRRPLAPNALMMFGMPVAPSDLEDRTTLRRTWTAWPPRLPANRLHLAGRT